MMAGNSLGGVDQATLRLWLTQAQNARAEIMTGSKPVTVTVTGGGQHREVTYRNDPNSIANLSAWIIQLQAALGMRPRRRAMNISF